MKRGDVIIAALTGDYGKPRPALIIQSDRVTGTESILICPFTSMLRDSVIFRFSVEPDFENGLREPSQLMVDKIAAVHRDKCNGRVGRLRPELLAQLDARLALVIGLGDAAPEGSGAIQVEN